MNLDIAVLADMSAGHMATGHLASMITCSPAG
jgi:hypothetical protein